MALNNPSVLQESICAFVVSEVIALSGVTNHAIRARTTAWTTPHELLQTLNVVGRHFAG